jgi:hypothetical protein
MAENAGVGMASAQPLTTKLKACSTYIVGVCALLWGLYRMQKIILYLTSQILSLNYTRSICDLFSSQSRSSMLCILSATA